MDLEAVRNTSKICMNLILVCFLQFKYSDEENLTWRKIRINGNLQPLPRAAHSAYVSGTNVFVFGGSDGRTMFNDLWILDTSKLLA